MTKELSRIASQAADDAVTKPPEQPKGLVDWLDVNLVGAVKRSGVDVINATHITHMEKPELPPAEFLSPAWFFQAAGSAALTIPVYVAAGRLTGGGVRLIAENAGWERNIVGKLAASDTAMQIGGAGIYDGLRDPDKQLGETRTGNILGGATMFGFLGAKVPAIAEVEKRILAQGTQLVGSGVAGSFVSQSFGTKPYDVERMTQAGLTSAVIPMAQRLGVKGANLTDHAITSIDRAIRGDNAAGRGVPIGRYIDAKGWGNDPAVKDLSLTDARLTRVIEHDGLNKVDSEYRGKISGGRTIFVPRNASALEQQEILVHETAGHKLNELNLARDIKSAAEKIDTNPDLARKMYVDARRADEENAAAITARIFGKPVDRTAVTPAHERDWAAEALGFTEIGAAFRPAASFIGGSHGDGTGMNPFASKAAIALKHTFIDKENNAVSVPFDGIKTINGVQYDIKGSYAVRNKANSDIPEYQRFTTKEGLDITVATDGVKTDFGMASYVEHGPEGIYSKYKILYPPEPNPEGIKAGSEYNVFPNATQTPFGLAHTVEIQADGTHVYRNKSADVNQQFNVWDNHPPETQTVGNQDIGFTTTVQYADKSTLYTTKDGTSLFELPEGVRITPTIDGEKLPDVTKIFRSPDGVTIYESHSEGGAFTQTKVAPGNDGKLQITHYFQDKAPEYSVASRVLEPFRNQYPQGLLFERNPGNAIAREQARANFTEITANSTRFYTQDRVVEFHPSAKGRPHGDVVRTEHPVNAETGLLGNAEDYLQDGTKYIRFLQPRKSFEEPETPVVRESIVGRANGMWQDRDGNVIMDVRGVSWPQRFGVTATDNLEGLRGPLPTSLDSTVAGKIVKVDRGLDKVTYVTNLNEKIEVSLGNNTPIVVRNADNSVRTNDAGNKIIENYNEPRLTAFGLATSIEVRTDGSVAYNIVNNPSYSEVRQFVVPIHTTDGMAMFAKKMADGWQIVLDNGSQLKVDNQMWSRFENRRYMKQAASAGSGSGEANDIGALLGDDSGADNPF